MQSTAVRYVWPPKCHLVEFKERKALHPYIHQKVGVHMMFIKTKVEIYLPIFLVFDASEALLEKINLRSQNLASPLDLALRWYRELKRSRTSFPSMQGQPVKPPSPP